MQLTATQLLKEYIEPNSFPACEDKSCSTCKLTELTREPEFEALIYTIMGQSLLMEHPSDMFRLVMVRSIEIGMKIAETEMLERLGEK